MNLDPNDYQHLVKSTCAICGTFIEPDLKRYEERGNHCRMCNSIISHVADLRKRDTPQN